MDRVRQNQDRSNEGRNGRVELNDQQRTHIRQTILARSDVPRETRVDFQLNVGVIVPQRVRLVAVPDALIEIRPEWRGHEYFVVRDEIIIVDSSRHIVATLPVGEQVGSNQAGPRRGGLALSVEEIRLLGRSGRRPRPADQAGLDHVPAAAGSAGVWRDRRPDQDRAWDVQ